MAVLETTVLNTWQLGPGTWMIKLKPCNILLILTCAIYLTLVYSIKYVHILCSIFYTHSSNSASTIHTHTISCSSVEFTRFLELFCVCSGKVVLVDSSGRCLSIRVLPAKPDDLSQFLRPTWWKERTNFSNLSSYFHTCIVTDAYPHTCTHINKCNFKKLFKKILF